MPDRAIWKAVVTFGGISVPVKLYTAVREQRVQFNLLHDSDQVRLQQQMICTKDEKPVEREHMVKGYPVEEDRYAIVGAEEIESLEPESSREVEVLDFAARDELDPRYYGRPYYLGPDGEEAKFATLVRAIAERKEVGLCQWVMRKTSYAGILGSADGTLMLMTMHYGDEVRPTDELELKKAKLDAREMKLAKYLVETLQGEFDPKKYHDEYQRRLREMIAKKARGEMSAPRLGNCVRRRADVLPEQAPQVPLSHAEALRKLRH